MAATKGFNSYVTLGEADSYFSERVNSDVWVAADNTKKSAALITATQILDNQRWTGTAISEDQLLAFPRSGEYFDPRLGAFVQLTTDTPKRILVATFELAIHLLANEGLLEDSGAVSGLGVSTIRLSGITKPNLLPSMVRVQITPLLVNAGSNSWWRAN